MRKISCDRCGRAVPGIVEVTGPGNQNALLDTGLSWLVPVWSPGDHVVRFVRKDYCKKCVFKMASRK